MVVICKVKTTSRPALSLTLLLLSEFNTAWVFPLFNELLVYTFPERLTSIAAAIGLVDSSRCPPAKRRGVALRPTHDELQHNS
jgi:hypothetical protein